jgi:putative MATE family efflux protein
MIDPGVLTPLDETRPPSDSSAAALPLNPREGAATVALGGESAPHAALVHGALARTILAVALPAVASTLLMTVFGTADAYWVGTRIGPQGLAAVSTSLFWIWMVVATGELVSVGLTAVAARRHGEQLRDAAAHAAGDALVFALGLALVIAVAGHLSLARMFGVMHTPADVTALGTRYLATYLLGTPLIFGFLVVDATFRASGDTRTPFLLLAAAVVVGLILHPVLLLGIGPAPRLGIAGTAVATIITRGSAFVAGLALLMRRRMIRFARVSGRTIRAIIRVGLPTALTGVLFSVIYILLTRTTSLFGTPALAALGVGHRMESWTYMIGVGFGATAAAVVGQNLGAHEVERAARAGWIATAYATVVGAAGFVLEFTLAYQFAALFTHSPAVIAESAHYLRIAAVSTLFSGAELVLEGSLGGAGDTVPPMLTSTTITALRLPLAAWAAMHWGTAGIWWTISLTAIARGVAMMLLWRSGHWKRRSV